MNTLKTEAPITGVTLQEEGSIRTIIFNCKRKEDATNFNSVLLNSPFVFRARKLVNGQYLISISSEALSMPILHLATNTISEFKWLEDNSISSLSFSYPDNDGTPLQLQNPLLISQTHFQLD
jgi:hypothetical protein